MPFDIDEDFEQNETKVFDIINKYITDIRKQNKPIDFGLFGRCNTSEFIIFTKNILYRITAVIQESSASFFGIGRIDRCDQDIEYLDITPYHYTENDINNPNSITYSESLEYEINYNHLNIVSIHPISKFTTNKIIKFIKHCENDFHIIKIYDSNETILLYDYFRN